MRCTKYIFPRLVNALRCAAGYALGLCKGLVRIGHMPLFVSVEPAAVCQLRCPECPVGQASDVSALPKNHGFPGTPLMNRDVWERVLRETARHAHTMQFYFQGEPLLNRDLPQMIAEAHAEGLYTIVSTNAQALTAEMAEQLVRAGLDRIIVSMDGLTQESYGAYRIGGSLDRCKEALRFLHEAKKRLHGRTTVELQCLRLRTNEHEWPRFRREYKALGADRLTFKTAQLHDYADGHPLMPTDGRYNRYTQGPDGRYRRKPLRRGCWRVWSGVVVSTTGEVLPCCYDKAHEHAYGNILETPLAELFRSDKANAFRASALQEKPLICKECWR